jgi:plastocyanin
MPRSSDTAMRDNDTSSITEIKEVNMRPGPPCLVIAVLVLIAIGVPARARTVRILMENLVLRPTDTLAKIGDIVEWTNDDVVAHTATARNGEFEVIVPPKSTASIVLLKSGTVEYYSRFHPIMKGRLKIRR